MSQLWLVSLQTVAFRPVGVNFLIVNYGELLRIGIHLAKIYYLSKLKFSDAGNHEKTKNKRKPQFVAESSVSIPSESRKKVKNRINELFLELVYRNKLEACVPPRFNSSFVHNEKCVNLKLSFDHNEKCVNIKFNFRAYLLKLQSSWLKR